MAIPRRTTTITSSSQIITMDWLGQDHANYQAFDDRMKQTIERTAG